MISEIVIPEPLEGFQCRDYKRGIISSGKNTSLAMKELIRNNEQKEDKLHKKQV